VVGAGRLGMRSMVSIRLFNIFVAGVSKTESREFPMIFIGYWRYILRERNEGS
jgi:hypothetical protein